MSSPSTLSSAWKGASRRRGAGWCGCDPVTWTGARGGRSGSRQGARRRSMASGGDARSSFRGASRAPRGARTSGYYGPEGDRDLAGRPGNGCRLRDSVPLVPAVHADARVSVAAGYGRSITVLARHVAGVLARSNRLEPSNEGWDGSKPPASTGRPTISTTSWTWSPLRANGKRKESVLTPSAPLSEPTTNGPKPPKPP